MRCRHCNNALKTQLVDLGSAPPSNNYLTKSDLSSVERWYPLKVLVCESCWLTQTEDYNQAEDLFTDTYAYLSSTSKSWLDHAKAYSEQIISDLKLSNNSFVIELACNDGYLLKNFVAKGIPCLGIEPTLSTAKIAEKNGIPVLKEFFGETIGNELSSAGKQADLIIANNVYAHVPDINDFTKGIKGVLKEGGTVTFEFPHLLQLIKHLQFDTIYHEHFSYLSLYTVQLILQKHGLKVFDVTRLTTHGGSLRVYACHDNDQRQQSENVLAILQEEKNFGLQDAGIYKQFQNRINSIKYNLISFLIEQKNLGKNVIAYGAAAKGNTLLNYAGIRPDLLSYVCDAAPLKQGKFLPGSRIPILNPNEIKETKPDYILILPWNIKEEIVSLHKYIQEWGGKFVVAVPELRVLP